MRMRFAVRSSVLVAALIFGVAVPAGAITASVGDLALPAATYSHSSQTKSSTMTLVVNSSGYCTGLVGISLVCSGWHVTIQSSQFAYSGTHSGTSIPAVNFSLTALGTPVSTGGDAINATHGPRASATGMPATLDQARRTVESDSSLLVSVGQGTYTQALGVALVIPGQSLAGTYTGTLTITITASP
jgi:hypothetical protein